MQSKFEQNWKLFIYNKTLQKVGIEGTYHNKAIYFWRGGSKITADGECSHEIKKHLLLGRKAMTNIDSTLKSRGNTLPRNVHLVKTLVLPVVMYGCEK